jgi:CRISPR-associated protein Cmr4
MQRPFLIHALSPLHAGTGQSAGVIDLPIARMTATGIPFAPGSSIKGVLRDARSHDPSKAGVNDWKEQCTAVFGPDTSNAADHAGALIVGDARLLALPVRSFKGTFAWVTSPLLLTLAKRDLKSLGGEWASLDVPQFSGRGAKIASNGAIQNLCVHTDQKIYLQDLDLSTSADQHVGKWAAQLAKLVSPGTDIFSPRFIVIDDDTMAFLWETATQVDQRIRIDQEKRTVVEGALWSEESLPPETLLIGLLEASHSRNPRKDMPDKDVLNLALPPRKDCILQFGGKATVGRGRCRMIAIG